jgi:phosphopantothenoylcysteine decarboxylase/phosphopantothenate--cysteine ligase
MVEYKIILGITGGIAAYKSAELVRILQKEGAEIQVAMTRNATRFISPLTFEALTKNKVIWDMFNPETPPLAHITWGQESDLIIIAPATANFIAKMAHGIADDFLSTMVLASTAQILLCPAMNSEMYDNSITQENIKKLMKNGCIVMEPGEGELACNTEGPGRLPEPIDIAEQALLMLSHQDLSGLKILITAGPTLESIDPVRYITNRSSGKMGYALARAAAMRGASVTLISSPTSLTPPQGVEFYAVKSALEMKKQVFNFNKGMDVIIKAAAVADYRPVKPASRKIKKKDDKYTLDLIRNPDILFELGKEKSRNKYILVGFAAETGDLVSNAREKLKVKNLDMVILNDVTRKDSGFDVDTNQVRIIYKNGSEEDLALMTKTELAHQILDRIIDLRKKSG